MAGQSTNESPARAPLFDYVTRIDPALSTFGWKIVGLAHLAMVLPIAAAFLPRSAPVRGEWIGALVVLVVAIAGSNIVFFGRMVHSEGYRSPPIGVVIVELIAATVAAAILTYAVGGDVGTFRPMIFVPTLLAAMIGSRWVIVVLWATATASVVLTEVAQVGSGQLSAIAVTYGLVWGLSAIMVHLLALAALHSDDQVLGLADLAGIAARANNLEEGIDEVLPVITAMAAAPRGEVYRVLADSDAPDGAYRFESITALHPGGQSDARGRERAEDAVTQSPTVAEIDEARARNGVAFRGGRALLLAEDAEGDVVAVVLEGMPPRPFDQLMTRFNLERIAMQLDVLVNRSRYVARLENLGRTDGLTGLANRRSLFDHLEAACAAATRRSEPLAVVMTDLDHFKTFNDSFGHLAGDDLLRGFASNVRERLRSVDFVARYGGEEFVLVFPDTTAEGAHVVLDKLHRRLRDLPELHGVTFSGGIAIWDGVEGIDALIGRADRAMYDAKAAGRDRTILDRAAG